MKRLVISCVGFVLLTFNSCHLAYAESGITVTGKGSIEKAPDVFTLRLSITERGNSASKTKQHVDLKAQNVLRAIKRFGIEDHDITSTQMRINPIYHRNRNNIDKAYLTQQNNNQPSVVVAKPELNSSRNYSEIEFEVSRDIKVKLANFSQYENILDKVTKLGINRIFPAQTQISNADELYQEALKLAVINAQEKADKLAKQLSVRRGTVITVDELSYGAPVKTAMHAEGLMSRSAMKSYSGLSAITAEVKVTFAISK